MTTREAILEKLGFPLDRLPKPAALYETVVLTGDLAFVSGCLPIDGPDGALLRGKLGKDLTVKEGQKAAALAAANVLRALARKLGSLDAVVRIVKLGGYVSSAEGFTDQHLVVNGASELMVEVLGAAGRHSRAAVGVFELPLGAAVEVEAIAEVRRP